MIAIINGCGSNIASLQFALKRLGKSSVLTNDPVVIQSASHIILPGVGSAQFAMKNLQKLNLIETIRACTQPVLGICLGMQILYQFSSEGNVSGLKVFNGKVTPLIASNHITVPHMGWNAVDLTESSSPLFRGIKNNVEMYFVHEFAAPINSHTIATCHHGIQFSAASYCENFYGVQFHPEKSGEIGEKILTNFLEITT